MHDENIHINQIGGQDTVVDTNHSLAVTSKFGNHQSLENGLHLEAEEIPTTPMLTEL